MIKKNKKKRLKELNETFWYKKFKKWSIKIKKIKPTPKSITHKKPIKISPSSSNRSNPIEIK
jgi:hypothetical protein